MKISLLFPLAIATAIGLLAGCSPTAQEPAVEAAPAAEAAPATAVAAVAAGPGEDVYKKTCAMCHGTTALGAPMVGDKADWSARLGKGKDTLYQHALEGFSGEKGVMPARGGNPSLDDAAIKSAVDYMVGQSQ